MQKNINTLFSFKFKNVILRFGFAMTSVLYIFFSSSLREVLSKDSFGGLGKEPKIPKIEFYHNNYSVSYPAYCFI